jgi:ketosteroid isomerase-like protein
LKPEIAMDDIVAIQQVLNQYSVASSKFDLDRVVATFAADGVWELAARRKKFEGVAAIRESVSGLMGNLEYLVQSNAPGVIAVDGDRATAVSVIAERGKLSGGDTSFEAFGLYHDDLVRTADGWRFARRSFETITMRSIPAC